MPKNFCRAGRYWAIVDKEKSGVVLAVRKHLKFMLQILGDVYAYFSGYRILYFRKVRNVNDVISDYSVNLIRSVAESHL